MIVEYTVDTILEEALRTAFRELSLSFCIDNQMLYGMAYEIPGSLNWFGNSFQDCVNDPNNYEREPFRVASYKRVKNIISRFITPDDQLTGLGPNIDRIYDPLMQREMKRLYLGTLYADNNIPERLPTLKDIPLDKLLLYVEDDIDAVSRANREENYTFLEAILFCCILGSTHGRSINVLNKELSKKRDYERAKRWFSAFAQSLFSDELRYALVRDIIWQSRTAMVKNGVENMYLPLYEKAYYDLLLIEMISTDVFSDGEEPIAYNIEDGSLVNHIGSVSIRILCKEEKEYLMRNTAWLQRLKERREILCSLSEKVSRFIDDAVRCTANLLRCLPESVVVGEKDIFDYLKELSC